MRERDTRCKAQKQSQRSDDLGKTAVVNETLEARKRRAFYNARFI